MTRTLHPVGRLLLDAARGAVPPPDGSWVRVPAWRPGLFAVVAFTGHAAISAPSCWSDEQIAGLEPDGFGASADPRVVVALAGRGAFIDALDVVLTARGIGGGSDLLRPVEGSADHPRIQRALELRDNVEVFAVEGRRANVVTLARGIGGLPEVSLELAPDARGRGLGTAAFRAALTLVPPGDVVLAAVSPGNVASLRAALRAGFTPVAGVQLYRPAGDRPDSGRPDGDTVGTSDVARP